jgi:nitrous oxidase accessory protein
VGKPVIQGENTGNAVILAASKVTLRGFVIRGGGRLLLKDDAGIKLIKAKECLVENNRLEDNLHGMYLKQAEKCVIRNNVIRGRDYDYQEKRGNGIHLWDAPFNKIVHNDIADARDGVYVSFAHYCTIDHNKIHRTRYGLHYMYSTDNSFSFNALIDNVAGAAVMYGKRITFKGNVFGRNRGFRAYGILWQDVRHSDCAENLVIDNTIGLYFDQAGFSKVHHNVVISNDIANIILENSENNYIFENNFLSNLSLLRVRGGTQRGRNNIFYREGRGNYWSGYRGYDLDGDGIGDQPYKLEGVYDALEADYPEFRLFLFSPLATAVSLAEKAFPIIEATVTAEDKFPLMKPVKLSGPPEETLTNARLRDPAPKERLWVALLSLLMGGFCGIAFWKGITPHD